MNEFVSEAPVPLLDLQPPLATCTSTQDIVRELAAQGAPEGTCVAARTQTAGRGRKGRTWDSPPGQGLYMSFLLRPRAPQASWPVLTPLVSLALAEALEAHPARPPGWRAWIKWPNDVYGAGGKVAGILAEVVPSPAGAAVVIGLGVNLAQTPDDFWDELRGRASSLFMEGFVPLAEPDEVARRFNAALSRLYARFHGGDGVWLREGLRERFLLRGARVRVDVGGRILEGVAVDVGPLGELVLETSAGITNLVSGEVLSFIAP